MRIKIGAVIIIIALLAFTLGSAALTTVSIDRTVTAGTVKTDTDANVVVKFAAITPFETLMETDADGVVSFDLSKVLTAPASGFNADAQFTIGSTAGGVFSITNNSNISIAISLAGGTGLVLKDLTGATTSTINSGAAQSFYFEIDTTGMAAGNAIGGTLQIRKA